MATPALNLRLTSNPSAAASGGTRGSDSKYVKFGKGIWQQAQAGMHGSKIMQAATTTELDGELTTKNISRPVSFTPRADGIRDITLTEQKIDRRAIQRQHFDLALAEDLPDTVGNIVSYLEVRRMELVSAGARLMDKVLLTSLVKPIIQVVDNSTPLTIASDQVRAGARAGNFSPTIEYNTRVRDNLYFHKGAGNEIKAFDIDVLPDILQIFGERDVDEDLYATLTPLFENYLRKDDDFKNAERTFMASGDVEGRRGMIHYYGIWFIRCSPSVMPEAEELSTVTGATTYLLGRDITNAATPTRPTLVAARDTGIDASSNIPVASDLAAGVHVISGAKATVQRAVVHFWCKSQLLYSTDGVVSNSVSQEILKRQARYMYVSVPLSSIFLQEDFMLSYVLPLTAGLTVSASGSGSGRG